MMTCIEITSKDGRKYRPMLQFEYDDIQEPVVLETDDKLTISYFRTLDYWETGDAWLPRIHCQILTSCRGYFEPMRLKNDWDEEEDMPEFFECDEYDERIGFKLPNDYPEYAVVYLRGYAHSDVFFVPTTDINHVDAVMWVSPDYIAELREKYDEVVVHDMILADLARSRRILDTEQFYTHNTIEIDKRTLESDEMGMVTYLYHEHCTEEQLTYHIDGTPCEYRLLPLSEIIATY